jgi:Mg2+ and Co2+ transporter CorA
VAALYFPALRDDVEELVRAHNAVMQRYDEIIDARGKHGQEDAADFAKRIQTEFAPLVSRVNALMNRLSELAQHDAA